MPFLNLKQAIDGKDGYSCELVLADHELNVLRKLIHNQWLYRLQILAPDYIKQIHSAGIEQYHECAHLFDHASVWPKTARVLSHEAVDVIKNMSFIKKLQAEFGNFIISDEENFGWENFSWRLARPHQQDYGSIHADKWFSDLGYYGKNVNPLWEPVKVWIPIYTVPGKNGLQIIAGSHLKKDWKWHVESRQDRRKPVLDEDLEKLDITLLKTPPGQAVVFHNDLLHGGAPNLASSTRVSLEFTIYLTNP